jgi:hypothetical protein
MSAQSETQAVEAPVANLAETRKKLAAAKRRHPTTQAKAAPAKKAAAKAAPKEAKTYLATATGRGGKTNVRKVPIAAKFAVDVADPDGRTPAAKAGLVYRFYADEEQANAFRDKKNAEGYDAIVIPATSKTHDGHVDGGHRAPVAPLDSEGDDSAVLAEGDDVTEGQGPHRPAGLHRHHRRRRPRGTGGRVRPGGHRGRPRRHHHMNVADYLTFPVPKLLSAPAWSPRTGIDAHRRRS